LGACPASRVYRLLAWLSLTALPEPDAARAVSRLRRADLRDDGYGRAVLDAIEDWLRGFDLTLR
jgi:hypothetical protein